MDNYRDYEEMGEARHTKRNKYVGERNRVNGRREATGFIHILSVLTFIGSGLSILISLFLLFVLWLGSNFSPPQAGGSGGIKWSSMEFHELSSWLYLFILLGSSVFRAVGAGLMLRMDISGYRIYLGAQLLHLCVLITVILSCIGQVREEIMIFYLLNFFICAGFLVMYTINKKDLS